jgi:precorrin-8X/cobalt-precorrin-8 methylmutase
MPLFDRYVAVDWSANNSPKLGADSIWACIATRAATDVSTRNHPTRRAAESWLLAQLLAVVEAGERILVGMDFPYGYPSGFAAALGLSGAPWGATWSYLTERVVDDEKNSSNRFEVASEINAQLGPYAPFWGRPAHLALANLATRKEVSYRGPEGLGGLAEWRDVERVIRGRGARPQPVWKLCYTGSVGSQTLVGIPVVNRLRHHDTLRGVSYVWPFEVLVPELPAASAVVVHAEIWPSIVPFSDEAGVCADERQVRAVVRKWRELDQADQLAEWLAAPADNEATRGEEGWVLGVESPGSAQTFARQKRPPDSLRSEGPGASPSVRAGLEPATGQSRCLCGCGNYPRGKRSRFMPGHDQRLNPDTGRRFNDH